MNEIWQYYNVLNHNNSIGFFKTKSELKNKLKALEHIVEHGQISDVRQLSYSLHSNPNLQKQIWESAALIYLKDYSEGDHYDSLRECSIGLNDIALFESYENAEIRAILLSIASMNGNGYVREKAIIGLIKLQHPIAIQFLLFRLSDWVEPIRKVAMIGIEYYLKAEFLHTFIKNIKTIENLKNVERIDLNGIYTKITDYISSENRQYVIQNFKNFHDTERPILSKHLLKNFIVNKDELLLLIRDKHFLVRSEVLKCIEILDDTFIQILLRDKSAYIRLNTLYGMKSRPEFKKVIRSFVADTSERVRLFARYVLKDESLSFPEIYVQNIESGLHLIGSILGLAETGNKDQAQYIQGLLDHPRLRNYAFIAICKLNPEMAYDFAISNFETESAGLRKLIFQFLSEHFTSEVHSKASDLFLNGDIKTKHKLLNMFSKVGGWSVLPDILIATADPNEGIRNMAVSNLVKWQSKLVKLFTSPAQNELSRIRTVLKEVDDIHTTKMYFTKNPLTTISFTIGNY